MLFSSPDSIVSSVNVLFGWFYFIIFGAEKLHVDVPCVCVRNAKKPQKNGENVFCATNAKTLKPSTINLTEIHCACAVEHCVKNCKRKKK